MKGMVLDVNVGTFLRAWVIQSEGSDSVQLGRTSDLWGLVKSNLVVASATDMSMIAKSDECIHVYLYDCKGSKTWSTVEEKHIYMNTMFRCYMTEQGHYYFRRYLERQLKVSFYAYMLGNFNVSDRKISETITDFLVDFQLPINNKRIAALTKAWYRFRQTTDKKFRVPIFF